MKKLDLSKSVYDIVKEYPEVKDIMVSLGFSEIAKPVMLNSVGRMTTIPKGAKMRNIPMIDVVTALMQAGFELVGAMPSAAVEAAPESVESAEGDSVTTKLKGYLKRLGAGEDLESVRADFAANFSEVEASEIMQAEQELMREGTPLAEVQRLCDVHSALFHGATREERIANAEKAVAESVSKQEAYDRALADAVRTDSLWDIVGHPLYTLTKENEALSEVIGEARGLINSEEDLTEVCAKLRDLTVHYAKKGDLLYPLLKVGYDISGPSDVMWTVDDEIRDELSALNKASEHDAEWRERFEAVLERADEMIYKEANILFSVCANNFSDDEWLGIYRDSLDYAEVFGVENSWPEADEILKSRKSVPESADGEIVMPGGHLNLEQLTAMLNTVPLEISFIDENNINRYFNEGPKVFKRPQAAIDREVFSCHPPKIEPMVRAIISDFREGKRDSVPVWMEKGGKPYLVTYMAVRNGAKFVGTMEIVQDMSAAKDHFKA